MPYRSLQQERFFHSPGAKRAGITNAQVKEWDTATRGMKLPKRVKKKKVSIKVNNRLKEFGNEEDGKIEVNIRKHKGNKTELADTVFHESYHARHPKATEKETYKKTAKAMKEMSYAEKEKLAAKVRNKKIHYKQGSFKRRFKMGRGKVEPGVLFNKFNEAKSKKKTQSSKGISKQRLSIMGLV